MQQFLDITPDFTINLNHVKAIQRADDGTAKVFMEIQGLDFIMSNLPYDAFRQILTMRELRDTGKLEEVTKHLTQLTKYQATPTP